jgi:hypothetical protein
MPSFLTWTTHISKFFVMQSKKVYLEFLLLGTRVAEKKKKKKNLIYIFKKFFFSPLFPPLTFLPPSPFPYYSPDFPLWLPDVSAARGSWNCWTLGCWVVLSTRSCWENNFNFGTWWIMKSRNFNRKFSNSKSAVGRSRTAEPWVAGLSSYPLDHEVLVERVISELPDELWSRGISAELWGPGISTENILSPNPWPWIARARIYLTEASLIGTYVRL